MPRRKYSDRERAEALAMYDACGNLTEVSKATGIPDSTLSAWINHNQGLNDDIPDLRNFKRLDLASKLETIAHQCAGLLPERLPDANVREIVGAMGQSIEKSQLLRGQATSITAEPDSRAHLMRSIARLASKTGRSQYDIALDLAGTLGDRDDDDYSPDLDRAIQECVESLADNSSPVIELSGEAQ